MRFQGETCSWSQPYFLSAGVSSRASSSSHHRTGIDDASCAMLTIVLHIASLYRRRIIDADHAFKCSRLSIRG